MELQTPTSRQLTALAIGAHPDDIEFAMAGTLLLLKAAGADIHMWNISAGSCGTATFDRETIIEMRWREARKSAEFAGAAIYPPISDDFIVFYNRELLLQVSSRIRQIKPDIILTHSLEDYMEDHQNTARLAAAGAFARASINFITQPVQPAWEGDVAIYHAQPHGFRDNMRRRVRAETYIDIESTLADKRAMLACHRSQKEWLDRTQGMDAYLDNMEEFARLAGAASKRFKAAEGWRRHNSLGFGPENADPLTDILGTRCRTDTRYEHWLESKQQETYHDTTAK